MNQKRYYKAKKEKPCYVCGQPTYDRARYYGKNQGLAYCGSLKCNRDSNPFFAIDKIEREMVRKRRNACQVAGSAFNPDFAWYCSMCERDVQNEHVTFQETHDPRCGGCGNPVEPNTGKQGYEAKMH